MLSRRILGGVKILVALLLITSTFVACTQQKQSPDELREKTAQATAQLKKDTKAIAEGIKEGWNRDNPLNINAASKEDLSRLPGISDAQAQSIIDNRPYDNSEQLVTRHILTQSQYDKIKDEVTAKKP